MAGTLLALATAVSARQAPAARSVNDGVYTVVQAQKGGVTFEAECTNCHDRSRFADPAFMAQFKGKSLKSVFDVVKSMPEDNPGSLRDQEYANIISYFLYLQEYPAGSSDLPSAADGLGAVTVEPLRKPAPARR